MRYLSWMSGGARFWHPSVSSDVVEAAFAMQASRSFSVGDPNPHGDRTPRRETHCNFEIVAPGTNDLEGAVTACLAALSPRQQEIDDLIETGGDLCIFVRIGSDAIQLNLTNDTIAALAEAKASLAIEVHDKVSS